MWALDFQVDVTVDGRQVRFLNIVDEFTREALATQAFRSCTSDRMTQELDRIIARTGYGINNINRFLQSSNPNPPVTWGPSIYKVGDPVVFNDTERFKPVIFNNLKGRIVGIHPDRGRIRAIVRSMGKSGFPRECSTHLFHAPGCRGHCRFIVSVAT